MYVDKLLTPSKHISHEMIVTFETSAAMELPADQNIMFRPFAS